MTSDSANQPSCNGGRARGGWVGGEPRKFGGQLRASHLDWHRRSMLSAQSTWMKFRSRVAQKGMCEMDSCCSSQGVPTCHATQPRSQHIYIKAQRESWARSVRHARSTRSALSRQRNSRSGLAPRIACTRMHTSDATPNAKAICRRRGSSIGSSIGSSTAARMPNTPTRMPGGLGPSPTYSRALRGAPRPAAPAQAMLLTISGRAAGRAARAALVSSHRA